MQTLFGLLDPQRIEMSRSDKENTARIDLTFRTRPGNKKLKISRAFVSTDWLAVHPNMDAPSRVTPWREDGFDTADQKNSELGAAHSNDAAYDGEDEEGIEDQEPITQSFASRCRH